MTTTTTDRLAVEASALADAARQAGDPAAEQRFRRIAADCGTDTGKAESIRAKVEDLLFEALVCDGPHSWVRVYDAAEDGDPRALMARITAHNPEHGVDEARTYRVSAPMEDRLRSMLDTATLLEVRCLTADWTAA